MAEYDHYLLINNIYIYVMKNDGTYTHEDPTNIITRDSFQITLPAGLTSYQIPQIDGYTSYLDTTIDPAYGVPSSEPVWHPSVLCRPAKP